MTPLTILLVQAGSAAETAALREALPRIRRHLADSGGFLGQPFEIAIWDDVERTEAGSIALAERVRARPDIAAVIMWGGSWIGPASAAIQQAFVERTADLPFLYLSGSVLPEHAVHPGSFAIPPAFRDKPTLLARLVDSFPADARVAWIAKANDDPAQQQAVAAACARRGLPLWRVEIPRDFETTDPTPADWDRLRSRIAAEGAATHWFIGAFALNRPLRDWLAEADPSAEVVQLNTGKITDWHGRTRAGGEIFFGSDGSSEAPDRTLSRSLHLDGAFPRIKLDSLLLLQKAASLVEPLPTDARREQVFERWLDGMTRIDGAQAVFVGTRTVLWFDPATRRRASGAIVLKRRSPGSDRGLLHPLQVQAAPDGAISEVPVVYAYVDLLSMEKVSIEEKDVELDFFLDIRSDAAISLQDLRFLNGKPRTLVKQRITEHTETERGRTVHASRYRVTGIFSFEAGMSCYPADCQAIELSLAPANPRGRNLIIQPPPRDRLDRHFDVAGWRMVDAEVSNHTLFWRSPTNDRFAMRYEAYSVVSFRWLLRRGSKDTMLFVAVPLAVLLGVSFFAAFSTVEEYGAKVEELTTAMLASIALYFATPKPRTDTLTILDRAFRTAYILIGGLLATILITAHAIPDAYFAATRAWAAMFPLLIAMEVLAARRMIRRQADDFRRLDEASET